MLCIVIALIVYCVTILIIYDSPFLTLVIAMMVVEIFILKLLFLFFVREYIYYHINLIISNKGNFDFLEAYLRCMISLHLGKNY